MSDYIIYQLVNGDEVIAEASSNDDGALLLHPKIIDLEIENDGQIRMAMIPYTIFSDVIIPFSELHVLSVVKAPPEAIKFYKNVLQAELEGKQPELMDTSIRSNNKTLH